MDRLAMKGAALLIHHCTALTRAPDVQPDAYERLEETLGEGLARLLVRALANGAQGHGSSA
jgi:hypothetical protein